MQWNIWRLFVDRTLKLWLQTKAFTSIIQGWLFDIKRQITPLAADLAQ